MPASSIRPAVQQVDRFPSENDVRSLDRDDLLLQNRLLRLAADRMQAEIFTLGRKLEAMLELNVKLNDMRLENRRLRAAMEDGQQAAAEQYCLQLRLVYASSSWRLTRPLRAVGRILKSRIKSDFLRRLGRKLRRINPARVGVDVNGR